MHITKQKNSMNRKEKPCRGCNRTIPKKWYSMKRGSSFSQVIFTTMWRAAVMGTFTMPIKKRFQVSCSSWFECLAEWWNHSWYGNGKWCTVEIKAVSRVTKKGKDDYATLDKPKINQISIHWETKECTDKAKVCFLSKAVIETKLAYVRENGIKLPATHWPSYTCL